MPGENLRKGDLATIWHIRGNLRRNLKVWRVLAPEPGDLGRACKTLLPGITRWGLAVSKYTRSISVAVSDNMDWPMQFKYRLGVRVLVYSKLKKTYGVVQYMISTIPIRKLPSGQISSEMEGTRPQRMRLRFAVLSSGLEVCRTLSSVDEAASSSSFSDTGWYAWSFPRLRPAMAP